MNSPSVRKYANPMLAYLVVSFLTACSALTIEVDVYKGSLTNNKDVQMQQLAAMAVGAEPLLNRLASNLDNSNGEEDRATKNGDTRYKSDKQEENDELLHTVNQVIALYHRSDTAALTDVLARAQIEVEQYQYELGILTLDDANFANYSKEIVNELDSSLSSSFLLRRPVGVVPVADVNKNRECQHSTDIWSAYSTFFLKRKLNDEPRPDDLFADWRNWDCIFFSTEALLRLPEEQLNNIFSGSEESLSSLRRYSSSGALPNRRSEARSLNGSNYAFNFLATEVDFLEAHAYVLFGNDAELTDLFTNHMMRIASSFNTARSSLHDLMIMGLETIAMPEIPGEIDARESQELNQQLAELIAQIIEPDHLGAALSIEGEAVNPVITNLQERLRIIGGITREKLLEDNSLRNFSTVIERLLVDYPRSTANALLLTDQSYIYFDINEIKNPSELLKRHSASVRRAYGLVTGPDPFSEDPVAENPNAIGGSVAIRKFNAISESLANLADGLAGVRSGLSKQGRLTEGLFAVIENYIRAHDDSIASGTGADSSEVEIERERLMNILIRFAEKLLFVANHESLFESEVVGANNKDDTRRYIDVLQAVGNSILIQTDELIQRDSYEENQRRAGTRESLALSKIYEEAKAEDIVRDINSFLAGNRAVTTISDESYLQQSNEKQVEINSQDAKVIELAELEPKVPEAQSNYDTELRNKQAHQVIQLLADIQTVVTPGQNAGDASQLSCDSKAVNSNSLNPPMSSDVIMAVQATITDVCDTNIVLSDNAGIGLISELRILFSRHLDVDMAPQDKEYLRLAVNTIGSYTFEPAETATTAEQKQEAFETLLASAKEKEGANIVAFDQALDALNKAKMTADELASEQQRLSQLRDEKKSIDDRRSDAANRRLALSGMEAIQSTVIAETYQAQSLSSLRDRSPLSYREVFNLVIRALEAEKEKLASVVEGAVPSPAGSTPNIFDSALTLLAQFQIPISPIVPDNKRNLTQKDVLDSVIASLRQEYIQTVQTLGSDSPRSKNIAVAIDVANEQRSNMVYIRQAASYLRSSYPTTSTQGGMGSGWKNFLLRHGLKSIPVVNLFVEEHSSGQTNNEIDKQFWQNINTVRVAGGGTTNYAVVKDDIGNWYVKGYSADPESIINSAQTLAMFNVGNAMGADLLGASQEGSGDSDQNSNAPTSWRVSTFSTQTSAFQKTTQETFSAIDEFISEQKEIFPDKITDTSSMEEVATIMTNADSLLETEEIENPEQNPQLGKIIVDRLRALELYSRTVTTSLVQIRTNEQKRISDAKAELDAAEEALAQANSSLLAATTLVANRTANNQAAQTTLTALEGLGDDNSRNEDIAAATLLSTNTASLLQEAQGLETTASTTVQEAITAEREARESFDEVNNQATENIGNLNLAISVVDSTIAAKLKSFVSQRESVVANYEATVEVLSTGIN